MEFKVYQMNEFDTVAARSAEEAIEWYKKETQCDDDDIYDVEEVSPSALTWDCCDHFCTTREELNARYAFRDNVREILDRECEEEVTIDGKVYTIMMGDLFIQSTYGELLKKLDPKEPMLFTTSEW